MPADHAIPSGFWKDHLRALSLDLPAAVPNPFPAPLVTREDIFEALVTAAESERAGSPYQLRLYLGDCDSVRRQSVDMMGPSYLDALPLREDRSLAGYGERLHRRFGHDRYALLLNESQSVIPDIWFRVRDFLCELYEETGFPAGGADANIFAGNYRRTPFGVHTDDRDVFTFIVEGRKTFLVWPAEALDDIMRPGKRDAHDYADLRGQATRLEGDGGDLLYWPHTYWHVAESDRDGPVTTLSVGLDSRLPASDWMKEALFDLVREPLGSADGRARHRFESRRPSRAAKALPTQLARALAAHRRPSAGLDLERELRLKWMCWLTGFGMKPPPRGAPAALFDGDRVRCDTRHPIASASWHDELLCSANGYGFSVPRGPACVSFLRALNSGRELTVADLRRRFSTSLSRSRVDGMLEAFISFRALHHLGETE